MSDLSRVDNQSSISVDSRSSNLSFSCLSNHINPDNLSQASGAMNSEKAKSLLSTSSTLAASALASGVGYAVKTVSAVLIGIGLLSALPSTENKKNYDGTEHNIPLKLQIAILSINVIMRSILFPVTLVAAIANRTVTPNKKGEYKPLITGFNDVTNPIKLSASLISKQFKYLNNKAELSSSLSDHDFTRVIRGRSSDRLPPVESNSLWNRTTANISNSD